MNSRRRGNTFLEFTLAGIPMIFVLISVFEMGRLMWTYDTLTAAITEGTRYAIVHGKNCGTAPNDCTVTVGDVARRVKSKGVGLIPTDMQLSLKSSTSTAACRLDECIKQTTVWPPAPSNEPGMEIEVAASYSVHSMISMLWPGGGTVSPFGRVRLAASSKEAIQF